MVSKILKFGKQKGSSLSLPAHGRAGARATSSLAAHFAKRNTKFGGGGKARAGKNSFPPTPFLFARPSLKVFQNSAFGFSLKKVRISFSVLKPWRKTAPRVGLEPTTHSLTGNRSTIELPRNISCLRMKELLLFTIVAESRQKTIFCQN